MSNLIVIEVDELENKIQLAVAEAFKMYMPKPVEKEFLTRKEVADTYHISLPTVHSYINRGLLVAHKIGGRTLFEKKEVTEALEKKVVRR